MKKLFFIILLISITISCLNKNYETKIMVKKLDIMTEKIIIKEIRSKKFTAKNDSAAYIESVINYHALKSVYDDQHKSSPSQYDPLFINFILLDENGIDITETINFKGKDSVEAALIKRLYKSFENN